MSLEQTTSIPKIIKPEKDEKNNIADFAKKTPQLPLILEKTTTHKPRFHKYTSASSGSKRCLVYTNGKLIDTAEDGDD